MSQSIEKCYVCNVNTFMKCLECEKYVCYNHYIICGAGTYNGPCDNIICENNIHIAKCLYTKGIYVDECICKSCKYICDICKNPCNKYNFNVLTRCIKCNKSICKHMNTTCNICEESYCLKCYNYIKCHHCINTVCCKCNIKCKKCLKIYCKKECIKIHYCRITLIINWELEDIKIICKN